MFADIWKHARFTLVSQKSNAAVSYSTLKCVFRVKMSVFVLVCVTPPTASSTNRISTPRVARWQKTQRTAAMKCRK